MTYEGMMIVLEEAGIEIDAEDEGKIRAAYAATEIDEEESRVESLAAASDEWHAHGSKDFDELNGRADPYTGMSEYDYDPGVRYNDGGEPIGYM